MSDMVRPTSPSPLAPLQTWTSLPEVERAAPALPPAPPTDTFAATGKTPATAPTGSSTPTAASVPPGTGAMRSASVVSSAATASLAGSPGVGLAEADALRRLGELELGDMNGARQDLELIQRLRRPDEPLADVLASFEDVKGRIHRNEDADARDAFLYVRSELVAASAGTGETPGHLQEMYLQLLGRTHVQDEARAGWEAVVAATRRPGAQEGLPRIFSAFMGILAAEGNDVDEARQALREVLSENGPAVEPLQARVDQYARLAATVGPRFQEQDAGTAEVYHFYRKLPVASRPAFMDLQETTHNVEISMPVWEKTHEAGLAPNEGVRLFQDLLAAEKARLPERSPSTMLRELREQFDAILDQRRPGESLRDTTSEFQAVRRCLHDGGAIGGGAHAFTFERENVPRGQEPLFRSLLTHANHVDTTVGAWQANAGAVGFSTFEGRLGAYLAQPADRWPSMDRVLGRVPSCVPQRVDPHRGGVALLPVLALGEGLHGVETVTHHLDAAPSPQDPTQRLEWLGRLMTHAETSASLDRAVRATEGPSAIPSESRAALLADLLEVTPFAREPWEAAVDIVERLAGLDATSFAETTPDLTALVRILPEGLQGTRDALAGVLTEVKEATGPVKPSVAKLLVRFAELYATSRSVPGALAILHKEMHAPGGVKGDGDWIIVGGVRVPRRTAVARGWNMQALVASGAFSPEWSRAVEG